jgi:hypothetical protein
MQNKNFIVFIVVAFLIMVSYSQLRLLLWPQPPAKVGPADGESVGSVRADVPGVRGDGARMALGLEGAYAFRQLKESLRGTAPGIRGDGTRLALGPTGAYALQTRPETTTPLISLGGAAAEGPYRFHLDVKLDPRGAGIRSVVLPDFPAATKAGLPKRDDNGAPAPLELLPADANRETPAYALYAYDSRDLSDDHPLDSLGRTVWTVVGDKDHPVTEDMTADGRHRQSVSFQAEAQGVVITKTFSLTQGDYHLGLEVKLSKKEGGTEPGERPFRYQLAGGRGMPIEGEWYTNVFRNALIARVEGGDVYREMQDLRQIAIRQGGNEVVRDKGLVIRYAGVALQYFASVVAVDDDQKRTDFLQRARPTLETEVTKGRVKSIADDKGSFVLTTTDQGDLKFYVPARGVLRSKFDLGGIREGTPVAVVHRTDGVMDDGKLRAVAADVLNQAETQPMFLDDITVRVSTEPVELKPGVEVVHKYLLYNGPVKAMLLGQLTGDAAVPPEVVSRYVDKLHLNTLTDYPSSALGRYASYVYWTQLIIKCTNIMHEVLNWLHMLIPNYGICIIILTVMVRGMMFPVSRTTSRRWAWRRWSCTASTASTRSAAAGSCCCKCRSSWVSITACRRAFTSGWPSSGRPGSSTWPRPTC